MNKGQKPLKYLFAFYSLNFSKLIIESSPWDQFIELHYPLFYILSLLLNLIYYAIKFKISHGSLFNIEDLNNDFVLVLNWGLLLYNNSYLTALTMIIYLWIYAVEVNHDRKARVVPGNVENTN